ncbi:MAG: hypothetical protein V9F03_02735 [Microthrixaceae bacterium]
MRYTELLGHLHDGSRIVKKGRHRRYEEARAMKRGPDLDIEALFTDLDSDPFSAITNGSHGNGTVEDEGDADDDDAYDEYGEYGDDDYSRDDEYSGN